jgi:signal transduction histidine kinase
MSDHGGQEHGPPWRAGRPGRTGPPWAGPGGPGLRAGRRFRRVGLTLLVVVVLLVAGLATLLTSVISGAAPSPGVTVVASVVVVAGIVLIAGWFWRNARAVDALMDAADRVAGGDYATRVEVGGARRLAPLNEAFNEMAGRLQTNEERRRELLADVAHELRTPLQVIQGSIEGMLDGLYAPTSDRLQPVLDETEMMARLLEDLRTLSMAEAGVLELHRETVDPRAAADDAVLAFRGVAETAGVVLTPSPAVDAPAQIEADPVRLGEILANLVGNAVRHTPRDGRVEVRLAAAPGGTRFEVADTGAGIPQDRLPYVFDRFVRAADSGGTGLGLAIAKRLVEAHGGTIEAISPLAGGTVVRFTIPSP